MFLLKLFDRNGTELQLGDIVMISDGRNFKFFAEVKYLPEEKVITPFHTFSFHSFVKIDSLPKNAIKCTESRYDIWFVIEEDAHPDFNAADFEKYLRDWRQCETLMEKRMWQIEINN